MKKTKLQLMRLAMIMNKPLDDQTAELFASYLLDLPEDRVLKVLNEWPLKNKFFPTIAEIREQTRPEMSNRAQADLIANRIFKAIRDHGQYWPDRARADIGELGWAAVQTRGGWVHLCEKTLDSEQSFFVSQMRDLITSVSQAAETGATLRPELPRMANGEINPEMKNLGEVVKFSLPSTKIVE